MNVGEDTGGDQTHQDTDARCRERQTSRCQERHDALLQCIDVCIAGQIKTHEPESQFEKRATHADGDEGSRQRLDPSIFEQWGSQGVRIEEELGFDRRPGPSRLQVIDESFVEFDPDVTDRG